MCDFINTLLIIFFGGAAALFFHDVNTETTPGAKNGSVVQSRVSQVSN